jgi:hypothetical protein
MRCVTDSAHAIDWTRTFYLVAQMVNIKHPRDGNKELKQMSDEFFITQWWFSV